MGPSSQPSSEMSFRDTTFLVVDDKPHFRNMVHSALAGRTAGMADASSVERAVALLNQPAHEIACIICDWEMSPVGGLELLRMIRCGAITNASPLTSVVILTTRADEVAVNAARDLDVNGFAVAPLSVDKLLKIISSALKRRWLLQRPAHYAAVPGVMAPRAEPAPIAEAAPTFGYGKPFARRSSLMNVRVCALDDIQPGAVLAKDLHDKRGHLLLGTGTELKPAVISRLKHAARWRAEHYEVWVGERDGRA